MAIQNMFVELELVDFRALGELFQHKRPSRSRETIIRDLAQIWRTPEIHEQAVRGHWSNGLANALDGSEDKLISREARSFWDELKMEDERERIIRDVVDEFRAGRLPWSYEVVRGLIAEFPKTGHMDNYRQGQSDEGEADLGADGCAWDDRDASSSSEKGRSCARRARPPLRACGSGDIGAGAPTELAIVPYVPDPTPTAADAIAERALDLETKLTRCESMLLAAESCGSAHMQSVIRKEIIRLKRQASAPWRETACVDAAMQREADRANYMRKGARWQANQLFEEQTRLAGIASRLKQREAKCERARKRLRDAVSSESGESG